MTSFPEIKIQHAYSELLSRGLLLLRDSGNSGNIAWVKFEIEHLHNIPSLIFDPNKLRHQYYFDVERVAYLENVCKSNDTRLQRLSRMYYDELWELVATAF